MLLCRMKIIFAVMLAAGLSASTVSGADAEMFFAAEDAIKLGDWSNAEGLLGRYLSGADPSSEFYREAMFELLKVKLELGKNSEAREMLDSLSANALPDERTRIDFARGFLQAASGDSTGAIAAFETLARAANTRVPAVLALARVYEQQQDFAAATRALNRINIELEAFPTQRARAEFVAARILTDLLGGNMAGAGADLEKYAALFDAEKLGRERRKLQLFLLAGNGNYAEYRCQAEELYRDLPSHPDRVLYYAALAAASEREAVGAFGDAAESLKDAFRFGVNDAQRSNAMLRLINDYIRSGDRNAAAAAIEDFLRFFPEQARQAPIIMAGARLRFHSGEYASAVELYERIVGDPGMAAGERINAAREGAAAYLKLGQPENAVRMYVFIQETGTTSDARQEGNYLLGRHNFDNRNYRNAIEYFSRSSTSAVWRDQSLYWLIQSHLELRDYDSARRFADTLSHSGNPEAAARGLYFRALAQRKANLFAGALADYLDYIRTEPDGEFTAQASLDAAECALEIKSYRQAHELYTSFAEAHPESTYAPGAIYKALFSGFMTGAAPPEELQKLVAILKNRYPDSPYTVNALLHNVDIFRTSGLYNAALDALNELETLNKDNPVLSAQILYERARILAGSGQQLKALQVLEEMQNSYPGDLRCAEAYLLSGDIASEIGEYSRALGQYDKALELRPTGAFAFRVRERRADALYSLYSTTLNRHHLEAASALYRQLSADRARTLAERSGSIYKLGKSCELAGDAKGALQGYNDLLYFSSQAKRRGESFSYFWCGKAAYAAVRSYLKIGGAPAAREARRVIDLAESLELPGVDFSDLKDEIIQKYQL